MTSTALISPLKYESTANLLTTKSILNNGEYPTMVHDRVAHVGILLFTLLNIYFSTFNLHLEYKLLGFGTVDSLTFINDSFP